MADGKSTALVVEDEKLINWSLVRTLLKCGFEVRAVHSGDEALRALEGCPFEVVVLDYHLPDMDGTDIARYARSVCPACVILLLTASDRTELNLDAGLVDGYFNKPAGLDALKRTLSRIAGRPEHSPQPSETGEHVL